MVKAGVPAAGDAVIPTCAAANIGTGSKFFTNRKMGDTWTTVTTGPNYSATVTTRVTNVSNPHGSRGHLHRLHQDCQHLAPNERRDRDAGELPVGWYYRGGHRHQHLKCTDPIPYTSLSRCIQVVSLHMRQGQ